jgi:hypothetical protein
MTIRRWMIAVVFVGIALGMVSMSRRSWRMLARAEIHAREERQAIDVLTRPGVLKGVAADSVHQKHQWDLGGARLLATYELFDQIFASWQRRADYHGAMRRKYERAARYPWFWVEPDPPEPERIPSGTSFEP